MANPEPLPGKGKENPESKGHDGRPAKQPVVFTPNADIRGGNVVKRTTPPTALGRAPRNAPPQQPTSQNHYMGKKGKADDTKADARLAVLQRRAKGE